MISPIERIEVFRKFPNISAEISRIQKEMYDADELDFFEDDVSKVKYLRSYDALLIPETNLAVHYKVIAIQHADPATYPITLAKRLQTLMDALNLQPTLILSHLRIDCSSEKDYPNQRISENLKKALNIMPPLGFENALTIKPDDFTAMVEDFYALVRANWLAPEYIFFCDRHDSFAFFICQYGNVHTIEFGTEILNAQVLNDTKWFEVKTRCYDKFSDDDSTRKKYH